MNEIKKADISAVYYSGRSDTLSRYFSDLCSEIKDKQDVQQCPSELMCRYCKTLFRPGNHQISFKARHKVNKTAVRLIDRQYVAQRMKRHLVENEKKNKTYTVITCSVCKKKTKLEGLKKKVGKKPEPVIVQMFPKELTQKKKKKLKKKADPKRKAENRGRSTLCDVSTSSVVNVSLVPAVLPKQVHAAEIKRSPGPVKESKKWNKRSKGNKLLNVMNREKKKEKQKESFCDVLARLTFK